MEQERALERTRAEARERVRVAQEREAWAWQATHRPVIERATLAARYRATKVVPDVTAETEAATAVSAAEEWDRYAGEELEWSSPTGRRVSCLARSVGAVAGEGV